MGRADCTRRSKDPKKENLNMKKKTFPRSELSETHSATHKGKAIDDCEPGAVGRRSFLRKMGIAGASVAPVLAVLVASSAMAHEVIVAAFKGGIGVIPIALASGTPVANAVQGIQPAGTPWRISDLSATVTQDGRIHVRGQGLLLAGGNGIGTNANQKVFATLICGTTVSSTPVAKAVPLEADGDFTIDDVLSPTPPLDCSNQILLIRNVAGVWFAAGIPVVFE